MLREYDLATGDLLASIFYNPSYEPLDVFALPQSGGGYAYAVLARDPLDGAPSKVEIRSASAGLVDNFWIMPEMTPK